MEILIFSYNNGLKTLIRKFKQCKRIKMVNEKIRRQLEKSLRKSQRNGCFIIQKNYQ